MRTEGRVEARRILGRFACQVPLPSHEHDDRGCSACVLESRIADALDGRGRAAPKITTPCPSCGSQTLFIGDGGGLTCSLIGCEQPTVRGAVNDLRSALEDALCTLIAIAAQPATAGRLWAENPTLGATLAHVRKALKQGEPPDPLKRVQAGVEA